MRSLFSQALEQHALGNFEAAEALYRQHLDLAPDHAETLAMLGLLLADGPEVEEAEALLRRALVQKPDHGGARHALGRILAGRGEVAAAIAAFQAAAALLPQLAPLQNDWGVALHRQGKSQDALTRLNAAIALDPGFGPAHANRGVVLADLGLYAEAAEAQLAALARLPTGALEDRSRSLVWLAQAAIKTKARAWIEAALAEVRACQNPTREVIEEAASLLLALGRIEDARRLQNHLAREKGVSRTVAKPSKEKPVILLIGGVGAARLQTRYLVDPSQFDIWSLDMVSPDQPDAPLGSADVTDLAQVDLVFPTLSEVDLAGGQIEASIALCQRLARPVLNPSEALLPTRRDLAETLFGDIQGLKVPAVARVSRAAFDRGELGVAAMTGARLVRPAGDHGGDHLTLVTSDEECAQALSELEAETAVVTEFVNFQSPDGYWRKYRLIFVDSQVFPYHLAICDQWMAHYWRSEPARHGWKREEEASFLANWRGVFGPLASEAIEQVARRLDLDYGGVDCALLATGEVVLFEANASFLLHLDEPADLFAYKHVATPKIRDAFTAMALGRIAAAHESSRAPQPE